MSWVAISPISIEKHQPVTLCPKTQAPAGEGSWRCSGTGAWQQGYWDLAAGIEAEHLSSRGEQHQLPAADLPCPAQQLHF